MTRVSVNKAGVLEDKAGDRWKGGREERREDRQRQRAHKMREEKNRSHGLQETALSEIIVMLICFDDLK